MPASAAALAADAAEYGTGRPNASRAASTTAPGPRTTAVAPVPGAPSTSRPPSIPSRSVAAEPHRRKHFATDRAHLPESWSHDHGARSDYDSGVRSEERAEDALGDPAGDAAALVAAASRLWPDPGRAAVVRRRGGRAPAGTRAFLLVPGARRPRLVLPAGHPRAAATAARRASSLTSARDRAIRTLVATAVRSGLVDRILPDRLLVEVAPGGEHVEAHLADLLGEPVVVSPSVGTARANRKPILQVLQPTAGRTLAWVKVGDTPASAALVDREAAALERLAGARLRHLVVPRVLHHGTWRDLRLLVLSPVGEGGGRRADLPAAAMAELAAAGGVRRDPLAASAFWDRLRAVGARHERFGAVLDRAGATAGDREVACGWSHGDWTPWNMAWVGDAVHAWDWERFETDTPIGADALHHRFQARARRSGDWPGALAALDAEAAATLAEVGAGGDPALTVELYLLDLCARYLEASEGPLGHHLRDRAEWLLGVVEERWR